MNSIFKFDGPVFQLMSRVFDMICLNLLCLLCCIPIITIGPSVTALYYSSLKITRNQESSIGKMFFHSFKNNLKQGILLTVIFIGLAAFLIIDVSICNFFDSGILKFARIVLYTLCLVLFMIASYTFPLLSQFSSSIKNLLKNAYLIGIDNLGYTLIIVVLNAFPWVLLFFFPMLFIKTFMIWLLLGFSAIAWINSKLFLKIFCKYSSELQES